LQDPLRRHLSRVRWLFNEDLRRGLGPRAEVPERLPRVGLAVDVPGAASPSRRAGGRATAPPPARVRAAA
jgi:hypothetical protein